MQRRNGVLTRDAFDTTDTGCSTRFTLNTEQADIPRTAGMRTATQFGREIAHRQHTNAVVILLAKQRHSTLLFRIIQCHNFGLNWQVATNLRIHQIFYLMKPEEIRQVEDLVNEQIRRNLPIQTKIMALDDAKEQGAMALFGEKYDDSVRVLSMGDFSTELCGGTHASRTGDIGLFRIQSESGTAAGIRRIEGITGENAISALHQQSDLLQDVAHLVKGDVNSITDKIRSLIERSRVLEKELQQVKGQQAAQESASLSGQTKEVKGVKLLVRQLDNVEPKILRTMVDDLKNQLGSVIIVLATIADDKVSLIAGVTKDLTDRVKAGELIASVAQQVGGKGGGRPDMAQAGGSDVQALPAALATVEAWVESKL